ncbi:hypothetical protein B9G54_04435 [Alloscardovia macacae]|uniref:TrbL/VirB6 plasmid conjugal transfer protein n=1 Tax=Alloscardovia macacae TaxID=1160091 RepID=A0A1Y2STV0_9BIFI|nr:CD0415/CD1112 family protein [Alloscardovia macacae]OTA26443.1 hypothetical protein B9G54_04435 [Alloscardovia macacae]OTA29877.1 hypothetical protein B9T39_02010 [Alloscardovia macacae]
MGTMIINMLNAIGEGVNNDIVKDLFTLPSAYNPQVYQTTLAIANLAVKPIATVVLSIMMLLELQKAARKADGQRDAGTRLVFIVLLKTAFLFAIAANTDTILNAIVEVTHQVMTAIQNAAPLSNVAGGQKLGDSMADAVNAAGFFGQIPLLIILLIPFIASQAAVVTARVVIILRFVTLYALTAFHPFPLMFIVHDDTRQWGINYFRQYAIASFEAVTIYVSLLIYRAFLPSLTHAAAFKPGDDINAWAVGNFVNLLLASVVLMMISTTASGVAKKLFGGE